MVDEWSIGVHDNLQRVDLYWGGRPHLQRIVFRIIPQAHTAFEALRAGEIDLTTVQPEDWPSIAGRPEDQRLEFLRF